MGSIILINDKRLFGQSFSVTAFCKFHSLQVCTKKRATQKNFQVIRLWVTTHRLRTMALTICTLYGIMLKAVNHPANSGSLQ